MLMEHNELLKALLLHLEECVDPECYVCGVVDCIGNEPLHHHHDGCPYCDCLKDERGKGNKDE